MENAIAILIIILVALSVLLIISIVWLFGWKAKYEDAIKERCNDQESWGRTIKIEQVHVQPKEMELKFVLHERFVDDTELFKKVITSEVARYMAEELNKDPYLCKVYHEKNAFTSQEHIKVRFRMLPYAEGIVWDDIFKEENQ